MIKTSVFPLFIETWYNHTNINILFFFTLGSALPYRFDKDYTTGNLYYTTYYIPHIGVVTPTGENLWLDIGLKTTDVLGDISVHPEKGYVSDML